MDVNNLTNVYNQNPTLQGSYTLQQYLDLFGESSTGTPPVQIPPTDPNAPTTPLNPGQGIINAGINQYQNQGGDGGGGLTLNAPRTTNEKTLTAQGDYYTDGTKAPEKGNLNFLDKTVKGIGSAYKSFKQSPIGIGMSFMNPVSAMASVAGMMGRKDVSEIDAAFNKSGDMYTSEGGIGNKDKYGLNKVSLLGNYAEKVGKVADTTAEAYAKAVEKYKGTKYNYMSQLQKDARVKNLKERMEYYAAEEKRRNDERMEASAANRAQANKISNRLANEYKQQQQRDGRDFSVSGPDTSSNARGRSNQASSERGYAMHGADGGVVSLKDGGATNGSGEKAFSAKVKELMDDGYEFGEAVKEAMKQGYMNGGRIKSYFKGGLVSLRGK